ncbi:hypothetical protein CYMTET_32780 [Cymbomonas tetramitiformis]|uniref:Uncharacterized protein n=1 Tax=Cymbomonas tetramitiformis TaxID=36881 RepID=A0AAE0FEM7_9CHLO|nr:hypothetical protein CYMTET_32780 [Cymbomonas tetramitiformis]
MRRKREVASGERYESGGAESKHRSWHSHYAPIAGFDARGGKCTRSSQRHSPPGTKATPHLLHESICHLQPLPLAPPHYFNLQRRSLWRHAPQLKGYSIALHARNVASRLTRRTMSDDLWDLFETDNLPVSASRNHATSDPSGTAGHHSTSTTENAYFSNVLPQISELEDDIPQLRTSTVLLLAEDVRQRLPELRRDLSADGMSGRFASAALKTALDAHDARDVSTWLRAGQECVDSCVAQLESGNWPGEHWSHAFLLGHSFVALAQLDMLEGALAEDVHDTLIQTGLTWKAIFRHSVILERPPEWLGRLLRLLERTLHYHLPYPDVDLGGQDDEVAYTIPSQMPTTGVPVIAPASQLESIAWDSVTPQQFAVEYLARHIPVVIKGHLEAEGWGALTKLTDLKALLHAHGDRLAPVDFGYFMNYGGEGVMSLGKHMPGSPWNQRDLGSTNQRDLGSTNRRVLCSTIRRDLCSTNQRDLGLIGDSWG